MCAHELKFNTTGLGFFGIGHKNILCDWVHADNLVHGILLAAIALGGGLTDLSYIISRPYCITDPARQANVRGKAFFICDNHPVNNFEFIKEV